jgi:IS30 family transposase
LNSGQLVGELPAEQWSPRQISRHLRQRFPGQPGMWLCHESIYQAVYQPRSLLRSIIWDQGTEMAGHLTITQNPRRAGLLLPLPRTSGRDAPIRSALTGN